MSKPKPVDPAHYRARPGQPIDLTKLPTRETGGLDKDEAKDLLKPIQKELEDLQEMLYAGGKRALLVVFQAMDAGGKDSTTRHVFGPLDPTGVRVTSFKAPTELELRHDFLWRIHRACPPKGYIAVFNRSHYEDVVAVRVKEIFPKEVWEPRYEHIRAFEHLLVESGTVVLKFFLHISEEYQKERMQRRLERPDKHWKFNPADLEDRARWGEFQTAWTDAINRCTTDDAPWYVIPAKFRPWRDVAVATAIRDALRALDLEYPEPDFDPDEIELK